MLRKKKKKIIQHHERLTSSKLNESCSGNVTIVPAEDDEVAGETESGESGEEDY